MAKSRFIPEGFQLEVQDEASGVTVYTSRLRFDGKPELSAICFGGKRTKHDWWYRFPSEERMKERIQQEIDGVLKKQSLSAERKKAASDAMKSVQVKVGDIFKSSWGYDQTNVDYYQVVAVTGATVMVREIASHSRETQHMVGKCVPAKDQFIGEAKRRRIQVTTWGDNLPFFKVTSYANAYLEKPTAVIGGMPVYGSSNWTAYA